MKSPSDSSHRSRVTGTRGPAGTRGEDGHEIRADEPAGGVVHRNHDIRRIAIYLRIRVRGVDHLRSGPLHACPAAPEELALLGAGWWAHAGALPLWAAWLAAWLGIAVGDTVSYLLGRFLLPGLLRTRLGKRLLSPHLRRWGEELVRRNGIRAILLGRFLVALRGPVYLAIGGSKYPLLRFELINGAVGLVEVALLVGLGYEFGRSTRLAHEVRFIEIAVGWRWRRCW